MVRFPFGPSARCALCIVLVPTINWPQSLRLAHPIQAHMDPTEIIVIPIPLSRLETFVGFAALSFFVVSVPWWQVGALWRQIQVLFLTTCAILVASILCGAHPTNNLLHTLLASFYVASLLTLNPPVFCDGSDWSLQQVLTRSTAQYGDDIVYTCRIYATLLIMIPFQILNILDSGLQVQRWPLPMILGSTVGWLTGSIAGFLWAICANSMVQRVTETCDQDHQMKKDRYI